MAREYFIPEIRVALTDEFMLALTEVLARDLSKNARIELQVLDLQARIVRTNVSRCQHVWSVCSGPRFCLKCGTNELPEANKNELSRMGGTEILDGFGSASGANRCHD